MALEYRTYGQRTMTIMTACPFCGLEFEDSKSRVWHFDQDHGPEVIPDVRG